jgi:xanthine dehydrogenase accessory factor
MRWLQAVEQLRAERRPGVLVTLVSVRGHAPRDAGAKMVVAEGATWDSIGGGNVEATAVSRARALLSAGDTTPQSFTLDLSDKAPGEHGVQCCGGEVTVLLEPLVVRPAVAVFGVGHVGLELARILARHDLDLHLVDSRPDQLGAEALAPLADADARVHVHHEAVLPELVLAELPPGAHVLVMTHDHAEDVALLDAALRAGHLGPVGVIGSSAKWARFRKNLLDDGHDPDAVDRIVTPIGLPSLTGKDPATIAVSVAAALLQSFADESLPSPTRRGTSG